MLNALDMLLKARTRLGAMPESEVIFTLLPERQGEF